MYDFTAGIAYLLDDVWRASNRLCQERFLRKSFYEMESQSGRDGAVGLPELKKFMQKISYKGDAKAITILYIFAISHYPHDDGFLTPRRLI